MNWIKIDATNIRIGKMPYSKKSLGEYAEKLCCASTFEESFLAFDQYANTLGFESALYSFIPRIALDNNLPKTPVFSISKNYNVSLFWSFNCNP